MSVSENFGALCIVRVRSFGAVKRFKERKGRGWLREERFVHLLTRRETMIGRALSSDLVLLDPTVSREHARLVLDERGWHVYNLTTNNIVQVNGCTVPEGGCLPIAPQDFFVLGSTKLQLIAPSRPEVEHYLDESPHSRLSGVEPLVLETPHTLLATGDKPLNDHAANAPILPVTPHLSARDRRARRSDMAISDVYTPGDTLLPVLSDADVVGRDSVGRKLKLWGRGVGKKYAVPVYGRRKMRWYIAGASILILTTCAIIAIILHSMMSIAVLVQDGPISMVSALIIPLIPAIGISLLVNFVDRFEREPWFLRVGAFLWGAVIIPPALFIEQRLDLLMSGLFGPDVGAVGHALFLGLRAGITEETVKGLGLLLLFLVLRDEFDNVTDGIVYGALIGAGFAMVENFFYFVESPKLLLSLFVGRIVLGWLCHSTFIACFGLSLGYIRHCKVSWQQIVLPLLGYLAAIGLHSVFDFVNQLATDLVTASPENQTVVTFSLIAIVGNYIPPFLAQMAILYFLLKSLAQEVIIIRDFLADEVSHGIVTIDEYAVLQYSFLRTREERRILQRYGWRQWLRVKSLYQSEIALAFRKWHVSMGDKVKVGQMQPEDIYCKRIERLREEIRVVVESAKA